MSFSVFVADDRQHNRQTDMHTPMDHFESAVRLTCVSLDYGRKLEHLTDLEHAT